MLTDSFKLPNFEHTMQPFAHQTEALELSKDRKSFALLMEMGTCKTKIVLDNVQYLFLNKEIDGLLIVAPKGCYMNWPDNEIPLHLPSWLPKRVAWWNADASRTMQRIAEALLVPQDNVLDIMCINVEALATDRGRMFAYKFIRSHYTYMAVDESQCIKNHKAVRTKACMSLGHFCDYRRILSGTPITKNPLDLFAQFEFLEPGLLGFPGFVEFKCFYANFIQKESGRRVYELITGFKNLDDLRSRIQPHSFRKLKRECLDLPDKIFETRYIEHTEEQAEIYRKMKEEAIIELSSKEVVTSTSVFTTMMKLHSINCGHVKDDEDVVHDIKHNRINELMEVLYSCDSKVIIWTAFKKDVVDICKALSEEYGEDSVVDYYGDTPEEARRENYTRFRNDPKCRYFVSTSATGGRSLTLVESDTVIYYSYSNNLEHWLQSQDRNHRPGQKNNVTYFVFATRKTVDISIMKGLQKKTDLSAEVLDNWKSLIDTDSEDLSWVNA